MCRLLLIPLLLVMVLAGCQKPESTNLSLKFLDSTGNEMKRVDVIWDNQMIPNDGTSASVVAETTVAMADGKLVEGAVTVATTSGTTEIVAEGKTSAESPFQYEIPQFTDIGELANESYQFVGQVEGWSQARSFQWVANGATVSLTINVEGQGTTVPEAGKTINVLAGSLINIEAIPADDWTFVSWEGEGVQSPNQSQTKVLVNADMAITAKFSENGGDGEEICDGNDIPWILQVVPEQDILTIALTPGTALCQAAPGIPVGVTIDECTRLGLRLQNAADDSDYVYLVKAITTDPTRPDAIYVNPAYPGATIQAEISLTGLGPFGEEKTYALQGADGTAKSTIVSPLLTTEVEINAIYYDNAFITLQTATEDFQVIQETNGSWLLNYLGNGGGEAPQFTSQPISQTVAVGSDVNFSVEVSGEPTPTLQWFYGGDPVTNGNASTLTISNVQLSDSGKAIQCIATNQMGQQPSNLAYLYVVNGIEAYNLYASVEGGGTVKAMPGGWLYQTGTQVQLMAGGLTGWTFEKWQGDVTAANIHRNPLWVTMDKDVAIQAVFKLTGTPGTQYSLTLDSSPSGTGVAIPNPEGGIYNPATEVEIVALPMAGYRFDHWSGTDVPEGATQNPIKVTMTASKSLVANFATLSGNELFIAVQPMSTGARPGDPVYVTLEAAGGVPPYSYQWYKYVTSDVWVVGGQNTATLSFPSATEAEQGNYFCIVTDDSGSKRLAQPCQKGVINMSEILRTVIGQ
ncbi:MAG: immunoglobulin domain-containing protein [Candidatus Buchananbacteria bacterium]